MQFGIRKQKELPDVVTDSYLHSMMMAGIVAAHETTANATANALKLLLENPQVWRGDLRRSEPDSERRRGVPAPLTVRSPRGGAWSPPT